MGLKESLCDQLMKRFNSMTKDEFLDFCENSFGCPNEIGLDGECNQMIACQNKCMQCWEESLKKETEDF